MAKLAIYPQTTALVLIDLQKGIVGRPGMAPRSGEDVVTNAARLLNAFRKQKAFTVLVHVDFLAGAQDRLNPEADGPAVTGGGSPDWAEFMPEIAPASQDLVITKRQWGAFHGTELDLQLRRRGITSIVLGGLVTNFGVESTARVAYELGYHQVFAEDSMSSISAEAHDFVVKNIFPKIGRVRTTEEIVQAVTQR